MSDERTTRLHVLSAVIGMVVAGGVAYLLGVPVWTVVGWGLAGAAIPLLVFYVQTLMPGSYKFTIPFFDFLTPVEFTLPVPRRTLSSLALVVWVVVGALAALALAMVVVGHPRHNGRQFDQFQLLSGGYSLRLLVPAGARSDQTVVVTALLQRFAGADRLPTGQPVLLEPVATIVARPMQSAESSTGDSKALEHSWTLRAPAGTCVLSLDYHTPLFTEAATVEGVTLPEGRAIANATDRVEVMRTGSLSSMEVFTTSGLTAQDAASAALMGSVVSGALALLSAYREGAKVETRTGEALERSDDTKERRSEPAPPPPLTETASPTDPVPSTGANVTTSPADATHVTDPPIKPDAPQ